MDLRDWKWALVGLVLVGDCFTNGVVVEGSSRRFWMFPMKPQKGGFESYDSNMIATLGIECKCCDDEIGGKCSTHFAAASCSHLRCSPWKHY